MNYENMKSGVYAVKDARLRIDRKDADTTFHNKAATQEKGNEYGFDEPLQGHHYIANIGDSIKPYVNKVHGVFTDIAGSAISQEGVLENVEEEVVEPLAQAMTEGDELDEKRDDYRVRAQISYYTDHQHNAGVRVSTIMSGVSLGLISSGKSLLAGDINKFIKFKDVRKVGAELTGSLDNIHELLEDRRVPHHIKNSDKTKYEEHLEKVKSLGARIKVGMSSGYLIFKEMTLRLEEAREEAKNKKLEGIKDSKDKGKLEEQYGNVEEKRQEDKKRANYRYLRVLEKQFESTRNNITPHSTRGEFTRVTNDNPYIAVD